MPRISLTDEQKQMVRDLPNKEKDKLLLRLIAKDQLLLEQLSFKHLEHESTTDQRVDEFREYYRESLGTGHRYSPGTLMMAFRQLSGYLSRHVRVTKDKLGEVQLLIEMFHYGLDTHSREMRKRYSSAHRWHKLAQYMSKRLITVLKKTDKLHPDLWTEFESDLNDLLTMIYDTPQLASEAERLGLIRKWEGGIIE